jgi:hypothetical protein
MTRRSPLSIAAALIAILTSNTASPAVIYDNTSSTFANTVITGPNQIGGEVLPAGTDRIVTLLGIGVYSQHAATTATLQAFLYANDGAGGQPGTQLWQSATMTGVPITGAPNDLIAFAVPNVAVPGDFTWTLQITNGAGPFSVGLPGYGPPSVGSSPVFIWSGQPGSWQKIGSQSSPVYVLASITAVPEPTAMLLLSVGLGLVFVLVFTRRQSRRAPVA